MSHQSAYSSIEERNKSLLEKTPTEVPSGAKNALLAGSILGIAGVVWGFVAHDSIMWGVLLVNFVLLVGLTVGGPIVAAVMSIVYANWGRPVKRMAEVTVFYAPFLFVILILLFVGADQIWEWTMDHHEIHLHGGKSIWLTKSFVFARAAFWVAAMTGVGFLYMKKSVRPDCGLAQDLDASWGQRKDAAKAAQGFTTVEEEVTKARGTIKYLAPWFVVLYCVGYAMIGYDLVMSIDPHWFSTMFGGWLFMQNMMVTIAFIGIVAFTAKKALRIDGIITDLKHHDIGKLTFGSSIFWAYLMWAQYVVIWYGNLPEETMFVLYRTTGAWAPVAGAVLTLCFFLPFLVLVPKGNKLNPITYKIAAGSLIAGAWLNLYLIIIPGVMKLAEHHGHPIGHGPTITVPAILVTIGAISSFVLVYLKSLTRYPIAPISDPDFIPDPEHI